MTLLGVKKRRRPIIIAAGLFGAALIYGDGAITPAISVLSALEGVEQVAPSLQTYVLPAAVAILLALFAIQPQGTARIGRAFGPIMLVWFVVMAALGVYGVLQHPSVLVALNPLYGLRFLVSGGLTGFLVLGGVFLCVTGAEALYADMGHFGPKPIRLAWNARRVPQPRPQLRGASGAGSRRRAHRRQYLLSPVPRPAAHAADRAGDDRDDHRQPIDHHRRLFDDAPGHSARLAAAPDRSSRRRRRATARSMSAPSTGC